MNYKLSNSIAESIQEANINFKQYFKIDAIRFLDTFLAAITNKFELNIINFDNWLHKQGYTENEYGSIKDYISSEYGPKATKYIISLLASKPKPRIIKRRGTRHG